MKECGKETKDMDKEHTGEMKVENSEENILETGVKTKNTVEALSSTKMETDTMVTGLVECHKEKVE